MPASAHLPHLYTSTSIHRPLLINMSLTNCFTVERMHSQGVTWKRTASGKNHHTHPDQTICDLISLECSIQAAQLSGKQEIILQPYGSKSNAFNKYTFPNRNFLSMLHVAFQTVEIRVAGDSPRPSPPGWTNYLDVD
jgi:hypothetical protein